MVEKSNSGAEKADKSGTDAAVNEQESVQETAGSSGAADTARPVDEPTDTGRDERGDEAAF